MQGDMILTGHHHNPLMLYKYKHLRGIYRLCTPLVSIGNSHIATQETKYNAPAANIGADGFTSPACAATAGAKSPAILLSRLAMPEPVPRTGAGNTSGVYAYITPYMTFWNVRSVRHGLVSRALPKTATAQQTQTSAMLGCQRW
jgi:hypothetical protein